MKHLFLAFLLTASCLFGEVSPHLILYFDINKTLIASDKAGNKSVTDVINELLTEKYEACWDEALIVQEYENVLKSLNASTGKVFNSFYSLLNHLDQKEISYSVILRSFGEEVMEVKDEVNTLHKPIFNQTGQFREGTLILEGTKIEGSNAIYTHLRRIDHTAIHDDWNYWNKNKKSATMGKPFYIDQTDNETLSIFFDDNINENDSNTNIIAPLNAANGELISIENLVESGQAVRVDTLKAILDNNYYINHVEAAIQKHRLKNDPFYDLHSLTFIMSTDSVKLDPLQAIARYIPSGYR